MKNKLLWLFLLQLCIMIYTISGIISKFASAESFMSVKFIVLYGLEIVVLGIYAIFWQQIIARIQLSIAYANKSASLLWSFLWAIAIFHEKITLNNIIGVLIVMAGIVLINLDSQPKSQEGSK